MTDPKQVQLWAGLIFGINFLSQIIVQPIWGNLVTIFSKNDDLRSGLLTYAVAIFLMSLATSHWQLFPSPLKRDGSGFIPASISLMATNSPKEKSGYVLGMLQAGATAGSIIGPFMGGVLAELVGYRNNFILTSAMLLTASLVVLFAVKEEKKPDPSVQPKQSVLKDGLFVLNQRTLLLFWSRFVVAICQSAQHADVFVCG